MDTEFAYMSFLICFETYQQVTRRYSLHSIPSASTSVSQMYLLNIVYHHVCFTLVGMMGCMRYLTHPFPS